jgi:peptidoglycan/LPS O-acetylase OafA/YrhL
MEGMRGIAVFLVFLVHYIILSSNWLGWDTLTFRIASLIHNIGHTGVDMFFMLSGFLIYGSLIQKSRPFSSYLIRRMERIYPPFLTVFSLYLKLSLVFPAYSKLPIQLP